MQEGHRAANNEVSHVAEAEEIYSDSVMQSHFNEVTLFPIFEEELGCKLSYVIAHRYQVIVFVNGCVGEVGPVTELIIEGAGTA